MYRHLSWYKTHQIPKLKRSPSRLAVVFAQPIEARCSVGNEDVVGAAPTTSEWSTIMLIANVRLILEIWRYLLTPGDTRRNNNVVKMTSRRCFDVIMTFLLRRESAGPQHPLTVQTPQRFTYMMTSSNGNIFRVTGHLCGEFTGWQRPVTRSFDVFFDLHPNKRLSKHSWGWWFETAPCPLWRHSNVGNADSTSMHHLTHRCLRDFEYIIFKPNM